MPKPEPHGAAAPKGSVWRLVRETGDVVVPVLILKPDGTIGAVDDAGARHWAKRGDHLAVLDADGVAALVFLGDPDTAETLVGGVAGLELSGLRLERIALPSGVEIGLPVHAEAAEAIVDRTKGKRENLVILRAGRDSLHPTWARDLDDADRNWDLCISWWDEGEPDPADDWDYLTIQRDVRKFAAFPQIFAARPDFWDYRRIWLPDDDLAVSRRAINRLFEIGARNGLDLYQPALDEASHFSFPVTRADPRFALRFTNFVEVMCPVFSREALAVCIDGFRSTVTSWGLDVVWPSLIGPGVTRMAIVDAVTVTHTRPIGGTYDRQAGFAEMYAVLGAYRREQREPAVFGGLAAGAPI